MQSIDAINTAYPIMTCVLFAIAGLLACCSPCILPVLPVYLSMLVHDPNEQPSSTHDDIKQQSRTKRLCAILNRKVDRSFFFALGIATAFATVTLVGTSVASLLSAWKTTLGLVGGIVVVILGALMLMQNTSIRRFLPAKLQQLLTTEHRLHSVTTAATSPYAAFLLGFSFSFAWTPCVGPMISTLVITAASQDNVLWQVAFFLCFTAGFIAPFLVLALVSTPAAYLLQKYRRILDISAIIGSFVIIIIGVLMICGISMRTPAALSSADTLPITNVMPKEDSVNTMEQTNAQSSPSTSALVNPKLIIPVDKRTPLAFGDVPTQHGQTVSIDRPHAQVTLLTCFATWCGPCQSELPHLQKFYETTCEQNSSTQVNIYLLSQPTTAQNRQASDEPQDVVEAFLSKKQITIPCLFDTTGALYQQLHVEVFPCTYIVDKQGRVAAEITGAVPVAVLQAYVDAIAAENN